MTDSTFNTDSAPDPVGAYPHARRVGNLLFLSGVGPRLAGSDMVPGNMYDDQGDLIEYDIEAQCHSVFTNVKTILEASGSQWDDLIDVTIFLTDMERDFKQFNQIYSEYFTGNQPTRTTIEINSLPTPIAIELKCIAQIDEVSS